jgi:peptidyl-prolyl cis-trans isomerase A (cyclophilin A)
MKKNISIAITALAVLFLSCKSDNAPKIVIETNLGNIDAVLYPEKAPATVTAFLSYIDAGYFKNSSFYRVVYNDVFGNDNDAGAIQGGIWKSNPERLKSLKGIPHEAPAKTGLSHSTGTLSLARTTAGSASTEFFICIGDQTGFDRGVSSNPDGQGFAAFGKITSGMDIVRKIHQQPANGDAFVKQVIILNIKRL